MILNYAEYSLIVDHCLCGGKCNFNSSLALGRDCSYTFTKRKYIFIIIDYPKRRWHITVIMNMNDSISWFTKRNLAKLSSLWRKIHLKSGSLSDTVKWQWCTRSENANSIMRRWNRSNNCRHILNSNHKMLAWWDFPSISRQMKRVRRIKLSFVNFHWKWFIHGSLLIFADVVNSMYLEGNRYLWRIFNLQNLLAYWSNQNWSKIDMWCTKLSKWILS